MIKAESDSEKDEVKLYEIDHKRDYIWNEVNAKHGIESINSFLPQWRDNLRKKIESLIQALLQDSKSKIIRQANSLNTEPWKSLKVSQFLIFVRTSERMMYEKELTQHKAKLINLVFAELLMKRNGKYTNKIK